ncbi:MAG: tetratricopeptide repeat protein, partial [Candidatus Omnitrophica bacterium]|nr:tetratricopeptide repeat protein [Candidatus Omnitrophota bacterium]
MMKKILLAIFLITLAAPVTWAQQPEEAEEPKVPLSLADQRYQDAIVLFQQGGLQAGLKKIEEALQADKEHIPSLLLMGEVSQQQGKEAEAKEYFGKIVKSLGANPEKDGKDYFHLGTAHFYLQNYEGAIYGLEKAISLRVDVELEMIIPMLFTAAVQSENIDRAIMYAKKYVDIQPENQQALTTLISALFQKQNYREAEMYALQLLELDDENVDTYTFLAMSQFYQQKFNDTIINAAKAMNRGGESSELLYMLAVSFFEGEVYFQAIGLFNKYLEKVPDDYRSLLYLGQCHQGISEYDKAEEVYI